MSRLVSVLVPVYNHEKFIRETIESIIAQSYANWELLIVDDCSTDGSWRIIQEYEKKDGRIKAFRNEINKGLIENWKFLIDNSKGDYIAFLEGDDLFLGQNLAEKMRIFEQYPDLGMVYCNFSVIDEEGGVLINDFYRKLGIVTYRNIAIKPEEYFYSRVTPFSTYSQVMVRKEVIQISGYPRNLAPGEKMFLPSDWDFNFRVSTKSKIYFADSILLGYRRHSSNSSLNAEKTTIHMRMLLSDYAKQFRDNGLILKSISYMRGKTYYFSAVHFLENGSRKKAWKNFILYTIKYPDNFFRDFFLSSLLLIRLFFPKGINQYFKNLYLKR